MHKYGSLSHVCYSQYLVGGMYMSIAVSELAFLRKRRHAYSRSIVEPSAVIDGGLSFQCEVIKRLELGCHGVVECYNSPDGSWTKRKVRMRCVVLL